MAQQPTYEVPTVPAGSIRPRSGGLNEAADLSLTDTDPFADLHPPLSAAQAVVEAARCIYCYGAPCMSACPTVIDIPKFIHQIRTGNIDGSARTILSANIMAGTCARACPTEVLCEQDCVVNKLEGGPIKIGALQRYAVDFLMDSNGSHPFARGSDTGRHIAVIGAGPAGLSFAHRAAMLGNAVTVFEGKSKPGGLNEYGLAAYKMVDNYAQREVEFLLGIGGITVMTNASLGVDITLPELLGKFDAVFLGIGLGVPRRLDVPGATLPGVRDALTFIEEIRQSKSKRNVRVGANVVVIGGGNTAVDAAIQAKRLGAENVLLAYRRGRDSVRATAWELEFAQTSEVAVKYWCEPASLEGDGHVERVVFRQLRSDRGAARAHPSTCEVPAELVLVAIGQSLHTSFHALRTDGGKLWVDENYQTSMPRVFAGGDCIHSGADLTVQAVQDGKRAAECVDAQLRDEAARSERKADEGG